MKKEEKALMAEMEAALIRRATGYEVTEIRRQSGGSKMGEAVETCKHVPGETRALIFFLKNRLPERWRDGEIPLPKRKKAGEDPLVEALRRSLTPDEGGAEPKE